jgi:hypothetical protein
MSKNDKDYCNIIYWDDFEESNLNEYDIKRIVDDNKDFICVNSTYKYTKSKINRLYIKTSFFNFCNHPFKSGYKPKPQSNIKCDYDNNESGFNKIVHLLKKYDNFVDTIVKKHLGNDYKFVKGIINTNNDFYNLQLKSNKTTNTIYSDIINYNVSKKYPKEERYNQISFEDLTRFLKKDKDIRFILNPYFWINKKDKIYGTGVSIYKMEIKFKDSIINSRLDKEEEEIQTYIPTITI